MNLPDEEDVSPRPSVTGDEEQNISKAAQEETEPVINNDSDDAQNDAVFLSDPAVEDDGKDARAMKQLPEKDETQDEESAKASIRSLYTSRKLRKAPVNMLLMLDTMDTSFSQEQEEKEKPRGFLRRTFLNPKLSLRSQLMLSFDSVNFITIFVVVLICIAVAIKTADNIKAINSATFSQLAEDIQGRTARYLAESLEHRLIPKDTVQILYELTRDRFQGYPTFIDDSQVPFRDMDTNTSVYPVIGEPLPLDWQITNTVTQETAQEDVQGRRDWYDGSPFTTASGNFVMQGACDPAETNTSSRTYWPNCTDANNDIENGGTMRPSNLTSVIHRKASDLVPTMKALYEYNQDVRDIGIYFANQGVGATVNFPHYALDAQNTYTSIGCEWMKEPNPYNASRPIGSQEEIDQCYPEGQVLSAREYNPLSRGWCRDQALQPENMLTEGPFVAAWIEDLWVISSGRAVYDRLTNELVACILVGSTIEFLDEIMQDARVTPNSEVSVIRWNPEGSVVASSARSTSEADRVLTVTELGLGLTNETYDSLYNLVDYSAEWKPTEVQEAYESFISKADGFVVAAYPIPPVPEEFDRAYRPVFFAVVSADEADVFDRVEEVNEDADSHKKDAIVFSVVVGAAGFVLATIVILITATAITRPLQLMNKEAELIVDSFGDEHSEDLGDVKPIYLKYSWCIPRTEITDVVTEFNKMISSFSGSSLMARSESGKYMEIMNMFDMQNDFMDLYTSTAINAGTCEGSTLIGVGASNEVVYSKPETVPHAFLHTGTNLNVKRQSLKRLSSKDLRQPGKQTTSSLFIWTVLLIVAPLLLTTITISAVVLSIMSREFGESVQDSEAHYVDVSIQVLSVYVGLRADFVSVYTSRSVRDLFLMTRLGSWILFDGLELADSFTDVVSKVNECKGAESTESCPWVIENRVCDCSWYNAILGCESYPEVERRSLQIPYFFASSDAALSNGTRVRTDFPNNSVSPDTTQWWNGPYDLPGASTNLSVSRLSTTYDRLRTISAFPLFPALTNYDIKKENAIGHAFSFEEDGAWFADDGCFNAEHSFAAFWQSTEENGAELLRPELCPVGKYGFDPRCREWYSTGRKRAIQDGDSLYITTPYVFAGGDAFIAQTATSPLIDPRTGSHVGQVVQHFSVTDIFSALTSSNMLLSKGGFPLLITPGNDTFGADTVVGPGLNGSAASQPVAQVVMPHDQSCGDDAQCIRRQSEFNKIIASMKDGNSSMESFDRTTEDGGTETVYMAYAPVSISYLDPVDSSDFTRGAMITNRLSYSLGFAESSQGILEPFAAVQADMKRQINVAIGILAAVIVIAVATTIGISYLVARSISEPMAYLLELIRLVNRRDVDQDPPMVDQSIGSKEVTNVSDTMESLYKVVRLANLSFYAGDLEAAYRVLVDASRLFRRMDNKKAIGVACNNLGNTMLAMYHEMQIENVECKFGVTKQEIIARGTACFQEAIQLGEDAYDKFFELEGWSPSCLDFMQQLSNRYFNRGMFLLVVKNDHDQAEEIERLGLRDLEISRDMDAEIEIQGEESGWGSVNRLQKLFDVHLVRIRGYLLLLDAGYSDEWEIDEKLDELFNMLKEESKKTQSDLFSEVSYFGRLQQAEAEMIKYRLIQGDVVEAAKIATRMLMEDEHAFLDAEATAIKALIEYLNCGDCNMDETTCVRIEERLDGIMDGLTEYYATRRKSVVSHRHTHIVASKSCRTLSTALSSRWSSSENFDLFVVMEQF